MVPPKDEARMHSEDVEAGDAIVDAVRRRYADVARRAMEHPRRAMRSGGCCGEEKPPEAADARGPVEASRLARGSADGCGCSGSGGYTARELALLPEEAVAASAGCGNPVALARLHPGEAVLDLGSGGGIDVLLSARRVGPGGFVWGLDMTDEMLALAEQNRKKSGLDNVAFLKGRIEDVPLADGSVDVVISNCVINLSVDKAAVLREAARVLRPGGRLAVYDIVATRPLPGWARRMLGAWSACVAGALDTETYRRLLHEAGLTDVEVQPGSPVSWGDGCEDGPGALGRPPEPGGGEPGCCEGPGLESDLPVHSAFIRARKPGVPSWEPDALTVEPATPADLPAIRALLEANGLSADGLAEGAELSLVARRRLPGPRAGNDGGTASVWTLVGCVGVEPYGRQALLRSLAVTPPLHGAGIGSRLVRAALDRARAGGATEVFLLTTTAERYFRRFGFERVERQAVGGPVTRSAQFAGACPETAVVMRVGFASPA